MSSHQASGSSSSSQSVSASAYLTSHAHQHPSATQARQFTQSELRQLVLEYLSSSAYADTARAFAREWAELDNEGAAQVGPSKQANGWATNGASGNRKGKAEIRTSYEGMDGVEQTPPPSERVPIRLIAPSPKVGFDQQTITADNNAHGKLDSDSDYEPDGNVGFLSRAELGQIRLRRNIRNQILSGRIQPAIDLLNAHFPSVLAPSPPPPLAAPPTPSRSKRPAPNSPSPCDAHGLFLPSSQPPASDPSASSSAKFIGEEFEPEAVSLAPDILALNLHLQLFLELMRAAYAPSAPSTPSSSGIFPPLSGAHPVSDGLSDSVSMSGSASSLVGGSLGALQAAVGQSQALSARVRTLPLGRVREVWGEICVNACGLMAYKDLAMCPVRGYLAQSRRETLAELVNAAVLQHSGQTPVPLLTLAVKQTSAVWTKVADDKLKFPPPPPGAPKESSKAVAKQTRLAPRFDLRTFLDETDVL